MTSTSLAGKVAVVTGGARGIGRAIATALAVEGADVAIIDLAPAALATAVAEVESHGRRGLAVEADIAEISRLSAVFESIVANLGRLDILVNNAGMQPQASALDTNEEIWDTAMDVNAKAMFFCAQQAGRHFIEQGKPGKIINMCSTFSVVVEPNWSAYCASKGAALQLTRGLASEWARHRINVNAIGPTLVRTEGTKEAFDDLQYIQAELERLPARALPQPKDVADAAVFLAGPRSNFIHGHLLLVDSGDTIV